MTAHPNSDADNAYWAKWQRHYDNTGRTKEFRRFHKDGVIDEEKFRNARWRILFVLKEPNHQMKTTKGGDIRCWLRGKQVGRAGVMLRYNLARWAHAILNNFADDLTCGKRERQDSLLRTAVINLKKVEGGRSVDMGIVGWYAREDCELLREQIKLIIPDLIVAGGTFPLLSRLLELPKTSGKEKQSTVYSSEYQAWVIEMNHPAAWRKKNVQYYEILRQRAEPVLRHLGGQSAC